MSYLILIRRRARGVLAILCLAAIACSSGSEGPTDPGPPQPTNNVISGTYLLLRVNGAEPGEIVTLANPDGAVIGAYRFDPRTTLALTERQDWTLRLHYAGQSTARDIADEGTFERFGEELAELTFKSAVYAGTFEGRAQHAGAAIEYDLDGDGQADTILTFGRVLGPGT